jgi:hypothetical protein
MILERLLQLRESPLIKNHQSGTILPSFKNINQSFWILQNNIHHGNVPFQYEENFSLFSQYSFAVQCPNFYNNVQWDCGIRFNIFNRNRCQGRTLGTEVLAITHINTMTGVGGMVAIHKHQKSIIVAFRGTVNIKGAFTDARFRMARKY